MRSASVTLVLRERVRERLQEAVRPLFAGPEECVAHAADVEDCIFKWSVETDEEASASSANFTTYEYKAKQLLYALRTNGPNLCGVYEPAMLVAVDDACLCGGGREGDGEEVASEPSAGVAAVSLREAMEAYTEDDIDERERAALERYATHVCRKCGSTDVAFELKQTRGADEPMTAFCACRECSAQWKH